MKSLPSLQVYTKILELIDTHSGGLSLSEIAVMTRAGPARLLGLKDRGHLAPGAAADVVIYRDQPDREAMFATPLHVWKDGVEVARWRVDPARLAAALRR